MEKTLDIVVGGQYGSEGKGKVTYTLANKSEHRCTIRLGGPNSGHTASGHILRQLPVSALIEDGVCIIGPGSYINTVILQREIDTHKPHKLMIDSRAVILTDNEPQSLQNDIGSTLSGTGCGVITRVKRKDTLFISEIDQFKNYIVDTTDIHKHIRKNGGIVEGTQGFGLSNIHTDCYPYATSRDTTASGFLSELGMSPFDVRDIYLVLRTFPIRVHGNSGPLINETTWEGIGVDREYTSATKKLRRVARFDIDIVKKALTYNRPSNIVLNHYDYLGNTKKLQFLESLQKELGQNVDYIGTSPDIMSTNKSLYYERGNR